MAQNDTVTRILDTAEVLFAERGFAETSLRQATPDLPDAERFWRLHFMLGTVIFTLSGLDALRDIAEKDYDEHVSVRDLMRRLSPVVVAGMNAPLPTPVLAEVT
ncbi:hypothetical protein [Halomonas sp.]|uniref:hypothetical protein n=1 Tax=Halomonas sp. TaxID=1486246 RepID=UPI003568F4BD